MQIQWAPGIIPLPGIAVGSITAFPPEFRIFDVTTNLSGSFDDFRVYNRALSATKTQGVYNTKK
jgi:hypothetical protein